MKIDWDPEARRGTLTLWTDESPTSTGECMTEVVLNEDELIALYRVLKAEIGSYVAEMDAYADEFGRSGTVGGWAPWQIESGYDHSDPKHPDFHETMAQAADISRKIEKGE